ncbi:MAG: hypothetical protein HY297_02440 [Thaumarchaeota archaeon]|nr:hypothetical protein [Nitrososphaerota archaeon]
MRASMKAYEEFLRLRRENVPSDMTRLELVSKFGIPLDVVTKWLGGSSYYNSGRIRYVPQLFYVVGASLGDGYTYRHHQGYRVGLDVRQREFAVKYAAKLSEVLGSVVKPHFSPALNIWFVRVGNLELFQLLREAKSDLGVLERLMMMGDSRRNVLEFLAGLFDAEGCVKVVADRARKLPKICLDLTNSDKRLIDFYSRLLASSLGIQAGLSVQSGQERRRDVYHLRIYRKSWVKLFLIEVGTTKLYPKKQDAAERWFAN